MDKKRKRELKKHWQQQQRKGAREKRPLPDTQMRALFDYLDKELPKNGCEHTRKITQEWIRKNGVSMDKMLLWLEHNGGFCDCEVLANSEQAWQEAVKKLKWLYCCKSPYK